MEMPPTAWCRGPCPNPNPDPNPDPNPNPHLYQGAIANALASFVGSYPWYFVFNALQVTPCLHTHPHPCRYP